MPTDSRRETWRYSKLKSKYGLTRQAYDAMFDGQNGLCAICHQPEITSFKRTLSVDHDHITGQIRGLLCHFCNTGLGKFKDNPQLLVAAAQYLKDQN